MAPRPEVMIAHGPTPVQQQRGWVRPDADIPTTSPAALAAARWLGLALAVAVAVLAAAPFGWLLGPAAARARRLGGASIVVGMAVGVMILGDILTVAVIALASVLGSGTSYPSGDIAASLVVLSLVGAMVVGP